MRFAYSLSSLPVAIALSFLLLHAGVSPAMPLLETVALTGDTSPGGPAGSVFLEFGLSQINESGDVAFLAAMEPGLGGVTVDEAIGIWKGSAAGLTAVIVGDPPAPGVTGGVFETPTSRLQFSNTGAVLEEFQLETGIGGVNSSNDYGSWRFTDNGDQLIYRGGNSLPGLAANAELLFGSARMNGTGSVVLFGRMRDGIGGITLDNDTGVWIENNGTLNLVVQEGNFVQGAPLGTVIDSFGAGYFNDNGFSTTLGKLREGIGGITEENSSAIFSTRSGIFSLEYQEGDLATESTVFDDFQATPTNNQDVIAIQARLKQGVGGVGFFNDHGIWVETDSGLREVVRTDDPMPGIEGKDFGNFFRLILNDTGHVAFTANSSSSFLYNSIYSEGISGDLELVARSSDNAPGTSGEVWFSFDFIDFPGIPMLTLNNAGQVAFISGLGGSDVTEASDLGIWAQNASGELLLIVREGDTITVSPGDTRTVQSFNFGGMNDHGAIAFDAIFTDGTSGVFVSHLVAASLLGDFNGDGVVDAADYTVWRDNLGGNNSSLNGNGDEAGASAGVVDAADYTAWVNNLGAVASSTNAVPEPGTLFLAFFGMGLVVSLRR